MKQNVKLLTTTKFSKDYYRIKYVEATNKIAHMTGKIVDLQQQLIERTEERDYVSKVLDNKLNNNLDKQKSQLDNTDNKDNDN